MEFACNSLEELMAPIVAKFQQNDEFLTTKYKEVARLKYEASLLEKESVAILSELKQYSVLPTSFFEDFYTLFNTRPQSAKQKKELASQKELIISTFFSEVFLTEEEIAAIKIDACSLSASSVGACCYYVEFIVPRFSLTEKIVISVPTYNISLGALESYCYRIGILNEKKELNFVGRSVYLSEILTILANTFMPAPKIEEIPADEDGDHNVQE